MLKWSAGGKQVQATAITHKMCRNSDSRTKLCRAFLIPTPGEASKGKHDYAWKSSEYVSESHRHIKDKNVTYPSKKDLLPGTKSRIT